MAQENPQPVSLPPLSQMTSGIPHREDLHKHNYNIDVRDSGNWSMPSKHSSTVSSNPGLHLQTILNPDDSPGNRFSMSSGTPSSARYPSSLMNGQPLPNLNQAYQHRDSVDGGGTFLDSRRSSIDSSRVSMGIGQLALNNPTSPYESTNASRTSLASSLQQQRGIQTPVAPRLNGLRTMSPTSGRPITRSGAPERRAPPIMGPRSTVGAPDPTAASPTKGFAWAFPDKPDDDMSTSPVSSRQNSLAASSINTIESSAYPNHHLHGLQPKSIASLHDAASIGSGNYSRTPELRISHKLAERKRRSEMKDLFEQLNQILPNSPGNKSSKWEVLTKAIDYINSVQLSMNRTQRDAEKLREEVAHARTAVEDARGYEAEITAMYQQLVRLDPNGPHIFGPKTHALVEREKQTNNHHSASTNGQPAQPTPQTNSWNQPPAAAMQGVEYGGSFDRR